MGGAPLSAQVCLRSSGDDTNATVGEGRATPAREAVEGGGDWILLRASPAGAADEAGMRADAALEPKSHQAWVWSQRAPAGRTLAHPLGGKRPGFSFVVTAGCGGREGEEWGGEPGGAEASGDSPATAGASGQAGRRLLKSAAREQGLPEAAGAGEVFGVFPGPYFSRGSPSPGWADVCSCAAPLRCYGTLVPPPATSSP